MKAFRRVPVAIVSLLFAAAPLMAQDFLHRKPPVPVIVTAPVAYGPYSGHFLTGGIGLTKQLAEADPLLGPSSPWTLSAWIELPATQGGTLLLCGAGDPLGADSRFFELVDGKPLLRLGANAALASRSAASPGWHFLAATFDGTTVHFYLDGAEAASAPLSAGPVQPVLEMAPVEASAPHFGGRIAHLLLQREAESAAGIAETAAHKPDFELIDFEEGSKPWPLQTIQFAGNTAPQDPATLPQPKAPFSKPHVSPLPPSVTTLHVEGANDWTLDGGWRLEPAPEVQATGAQISTPGFNAEHWLAAEVPGTVLSTMIARGVYPDPDYGLDNLDIPEKLNKQDYWYRASFHAPADGENRTFSLLLDGVNYHAEVWLNGQHLGDTTGAFLRGVFDATHAMHRGGENVLAILVSPPPHPGIPNEQSIAFGAGLNGGAMAIDGPTFMATEGWDWFPPMRDRDTGLWQPVHLLASGAVTIGDPQVITHLPLPDITQADLTINVPLENKTAAPVTGTVSVTFEGVSAEEQVTVPPGGATAQFAPGAFPQMHLDHPRLWWPNGYGKPELYHLKARFVAAGEGAQSAEEKDLRFGVREITYELSLLDNKGALRRVEYDPTTGREAAEPQVDVTHAAMRQVPGGWASSIAAGQDDSPVFHAVSDPPSLPDLILRVNGVRIAVRGGSWGMDDSRKRISRAHLEPFFRYDRDANLNVIRNWQGQDTEPVFYDLADEYGMMVWNDFWEVTTDSNAEAEDPQLFLRNAKDTILRYRNHPSIVMWCGRNEGVPQPIINKGLITLTHTLDGTRYYSPSSNQVNLEPSGPYAYEDPVDYYTKLDPGFAVEVGVPSLPTLEWFSRWMPDADRWPISDDWGYHNWHPRDPYNRHMVAQFGESSSLADYERKAQMVNYVAYRAIFEGFNAHLWAPNGGRLLWMTQPAWPSLLWGILSSDYDTQASYYATKKACEPVHVQLDLSNDTVQVINTTRAPLDGVIAVADVYSLDNTLLFHTQAALDAATDSVTNSVQIPVANLDRGRAVFVRLLLKASDGTLLSRNFYWQAPNDNDYRVLDSLATTTVGMITRRAGPHQVLVSLRNTGATAALEAKLVALDTKDGAAVLPVYYSDNYISLLPGESAQVTVDLPDGTDPSAVEFHLRGWNVRAATQRVP